MKVGKVYLVGAGPGDPGLISEKGLQCLSQADVIIYDRLVDERLLGAAPLEAERIYVGKSTKEHTREQGEINQLLVEKARDGNTVVRLKGGDPFVLGRGGEEAEALADRSIPFEVVPGASSAVAVPAYAGIPVTHRNLASSFAVFTGHENTSQASSSIDWEKLTKGVDTLVFLMGMENLPIIVGKLLEYGRPPDTPVAVIKNGTQPEQKTIVGSLKDIEDKVREHRFGPPAVIVVGEVVRLRRKLRWFDNRPLFGKRILVTRAQHQANALNQLLSERGARPVELPVIDIQATANTKELDRAISNLEQYDWIVFTSVNGVSSFFQRLYELKLDARALKGLKIGVIGPATAKALEIRGIIPDYLPQVYTSQGFLAGLSRQDITGQQFLLPRADIADKELAEAISQLGAEVYEVVVYRTVPVATAIPQVKEMLLSREIDVITFTSSSTVSNLVALFNKEELAANNAKIACIGPKTADTAARVGLKVDIVASENTIPGLVTAIEKYFSKEA
ncbi:MAG TPA: uroporphyrinogen-III C-methyltransferase [Dehalococcoidia bacterium]|nr:uroporphyrinogen-III C-methyltransferase [Dehalococcoidia bacterium]